MQLVRYMRVPAAGVIAAGLLGACSANVEFSRTSSVDKVKLAAEVKQQLEAQTGAKADSVVCEGDLAAEVGATQRCVLTADSEKYGVTVTASSVEGTRVKFDIKVDDSPTTP
ncbi:Uncharacterised protein [Mycolicibacterium fortuitum]|uniref:DUF4333 domain-containing protein n=1 Tax=Mycolicibacterium fortuitum TaxID=1766 RepID=A0A378WEZ0_MYCFO|nr:Uncharacterised protein [Mycolicibacterium fortuitum]